MTIAELREALDRYDAVREVAVSAGSMWWPVESVGSLEPGGAVVLWLGTVAPGPRALSESAIGGCE